MTILLIIAAVAGTYITWRMLRTIPWAATLRLAATLTIVIITILAIIHYNVDIHALLAVLIPDFGGTR
jgi:hypothetical protein